MTALAPEFPRSLFRHKPFAFFWSARVLSTVAFQLQGVAVGWQIYALTHSAFALGMVGLVQFLPMLGLTLSSAMWPTATTAGASSPSASSWRGWRRAF